MYQCGCTYGCSSVCLLQWVCLQMFLCVHTPVAHVQRLQDAVHVARVDCVCVGVLMGVPGCVSVWVYLWVFLGVCTYLSHVARRTQFM